MKAEYKTELRQAYEHLRNALQIFSEAADRQEKNPDKGAIIFGAVVSAPIIAAGYVVEVGSRLAWVGLKNLERRLAA